MAERGRNIARERVEPSSRAPADRPARACRTLAPVHRSFALAALLLAPTLACRPVVSNRDARELGYGDRSTARQASAYDGEVPERPAPTPIDPSVLAHLAPAETDGTPLVGLIDVQFACAHLSGLPDTPWPRGPQAEDGRELPAPPPPPDLGEASTPDAPTPDAPKPDAPKPDAPDPRTAPPNATSDGQGEQPGDTIQLSELADPACLRQLSRDRVFRPILEWQAFLVCVLELDQAAGLAACSDAHPMALTTVPEHPLESRVCAQIIAMTLLSDFGSDLAFDRSDIEDFNPILTECVRGFVEEERSSRSPSEYLAYLDCFETAADVEALSSCE